MKSIVPNESSQLSLFPLIQDQTKQFETNLYNIGLFSGNQMNKRNVLSLYIDNIEIHFAEKKRDHILFTAREIIIHDKYDSINSDQSLLGETEQNQGNLQLFYFSNRLIFKSANDLVLLCKNSLSESLKSSSLCCLFATHTFMVAFEFQQQLHQKEDDKFLYTFIDCAPLFKDHADTFFKEYIEKQKQSILSYYENCNGLDDTKDDEVMQNTESNFKRMLNEVSKLATTWRTAFTTEDYLSLVAFFVNSILSKFIDMLLALENISSLETSRLSQLCSHFLMFQQLFLYPGEPEELAKPRMKLIKNWKKVWQLNRVLDLTLSEIVGLYNKGLLSRLSNQELKMLVLSIFAEFDLRTTFLETLDNKINRINK
ncbi:centrosomal protein 103 kDa [Heterostelium album PN500]|uniref:Centrosomal protein 103 kDa n=1 Tax=Heterostelium pallidum (strain ATCC 26659 / Pp 5 / PN500) TaxID=670386 RepID=D3B0D5_HETP5|nr:centrosomal protein 103 kDa [Heterostelium album PN500]EFA84759.1 centrosomal protein 103 kDa [Heterostelium album PN500]|eukprot:XP_020436871.1 centrosomal protein 103 kDa [Heterostelium album PN500]